MRDFPDASFAAGPVPAVSSISAFENLISPITVQEFLADYWRRRVCVKRGQGAQNFASLFRLEEVDTLFSASAPNAADWFFFQAGLNVPRETFSNEAGHVHLNAIRALYRDGGTIHLRNMQKYMPRAEALWRDVESLFQARARLNFWLTRFNDFEPFLHYDTHDIFILQLHGRKNWKIYERDPKSFAPKNPDVRVDRSQVGPLAHELIIEAGDLIYVPAGTPHEVTTCDPHSCHIALGIHPTLWHDVIDTALKDLRLRGSVLSEVVPLHMLHDPEILREGLAAILARMIDDVDSSLIAEMIADEFRKEAAPPRDDHFFKTVLADAIVTSDQPVRRRDKSAAEVRIDARAGLCRILFSGGGGMEGPEAVAHLLRFVATTTSVFTAHDMPDDFDLDSRAMLLTELLHRGFLDFADGSSRQTALQQSPNGAGQFFNRDKTKID